MWNMLSGCMGYGSPGSVFKIPFNIIICYEAIGKFSVHIPLRKDFY